MNPSYVKKIIFFRMVSIFFFLFRSLRAPVSCSTWSVSPGEAVSCLCPEQLVHCFPQWPIHRFKIKYIQNLTLYLRYEVCFSAPPSFKVNSETKPSFPGPLLSSLSGHERLEAAAMHQDNSWKLLGFSKAIKRPNKKAPNTAFQIPCYLISHPSSPLCLFLKNVSCKEH